MWRLGVVLRLLLLLELSAFVQAAAAAGLVPSWCSRLPIAWRRLGAVWGMVGCNLDVDLLTKGKKFGVFAKIVWKFELWRRGN